MDNLRKMLEDMMGLDGYQALSKAIYKQRSQSVVDPSEQLLGLLTAPRAVLSWLVANVKPMKVGEHKEMKFPGREDISIHIEKQDLDVYRAEFIQEGSIIHRFEKQSLPVMASHMVTTGELYEGDAADQKVKPNEEIKEPKKEEDVKGPQSFDAVKAILSGNNLQPASSEDVKWMWAHANVKELTGVIGKLIDALVSKHKTRKDFTDEMDKRELKGDKQEVKDDECPMEVAEAQKKIADGDKAVIQESKQQALTHKFTEKKELSGDKQKVEDDESPEKVAKERQKIEDKDKAVVQESQQQALTHKFTEKKELADDKQEVKDCESPEEVAKERQKVADKDKAIITESKQQAMTHKFIAKEEMAKAPVAVNEPLKKPYVSDAQRRWAHTARGLKALGGKKAVAHWDASSKGKDLPERVAKEELDKAKIFDFKTGKMLADTTPPKAADAPPQKVGPLGSHTIPATQQAPKAPKTPKQKLRSKAAKVKTTVTPKTPPPPVAPKPSNPQQDPLVGTSRVHLSHGIGVIKGVESRTFPPSEGQPTPKEQSFYIMEIQDQGAPKKVFVPKEHIHTRTRAITDPKTAEGIRQYLKSPHTPSPIDHQTWNRRYREYMDKIHTGRIQDVAEVYKDLMHLRTQKEMSFGERKLLDQASSLLDTELKNATGKGLEEEVGKAEITEKATSDEIAAKFKARQTAKLTPPPAPKSTAITDKLKARARAKLGLPSGTEDVTSAGEQTAHYMAMQPKDPQAYKAWLKQQRAGLESQEQAKLHRKMARPVANQILRSPEAGKEWKGLQAASWAERQAKLRAQAALTNKAEMPSGAGVPKKPSMPMPPKPPVPASNQPASAAAKQAQRSARGQQPKPPKPNMKMPKQTQAKPTSPTQKVELNGVQPEVTKAKHQFFKQQLNRIKSKVVAKTEKSFPVTKDELYTPCNHCGIPEFVKSADGKPQFRPCMCFRSEVVANDGKTKKKFVDITKSEDGQFHLTFDKSADSESVKAFLLLLKASLLAKKLE